jgi:hypothetical protein
MKAPSSNVQAPEKHQNPNIKHQQTFNPPNTESIADGNGKKTSSRIGTNCDFCLTAD